MTNVDEPIDGPVTVDGHIWNIGDRVYFPCYSMGSITAMHRAPYAAENWQIRAHALCDDGEVRTCNLRLQGQFLGYGDHKNIYASSSLEELEAYYKNKPKHAMPLEVMRMARQQRDEPYPDDSPAVATRRSTPQSVTSARRSAPAGDAPQSVTSVARSAAAPMAKHDRIVLRCDHCRSEFTSARGHAKTCSPKCRKALSRKIDKLSL